MPEGGDAFDTDTRVYHYSHASTVDDGFVFTWLIYQPQADGSPRGPLYQTNTARFYKGPGASGVNCVDIEVNGVGGPSCADPTFDYAQADMGASALVTGEQQGTWIFEGYDETSTLAFTASFVLLGPECTCAPSLQDSGGTKKYAVAAPGASTQLVGKLKNKFPRSCTYDWSLTQVVGPPPTITVTSPPTLSGAVVVPAASESDLTFDFDIPAPNDATAMAQYRLECISQGRSATDVGGVVLIPIAETTVSLGRDPASQSANLQMFKATLDPSATPYFGREVTEVGTVSDTCWFAGSKFDMASITGLRSEVMNETGVSTWGATGDVAPSPEDLVGWLPGPILYYRNHGRANPSCQFDGLQTMQIEISPGANTFEAYETHDIGSSISGVGLAAPVGSKTFDDDGDGHAEDDDHDGILGEIDPSIGLYEDCDDSNAALDAASGTCCSISAWRDGQHPATEICRQ